MGLMPDQFYSLTWNQYLIKTKGYLRKCEKDKELMRWAVWHVMAPHVKKMPSMEKLLALSTDNVESPEEMANRIKERLIKAGRKFDGK